jgi:hypothetical protein
MAITHYSRAQATAISRWLDASVPEMKVVHGDPPGPGGDAVVHYFLFEDGKLQSVGRLVVDVDGRCRQVDGQIVWNDDE